MVEPQQTEKSIFLAAVEIESDAERSAFVEQACAGNAALRAEVEALLHAHAKPQPLLDAVSVPCPTIDQPFNEAPGALIGPYKLIEQIGEGGMGTVWMAQQTEPVKRLVALKLIKSGMDSRQVIARFEAERQALAIMDHPNVAKILDGGTTAAGRPFFVMDLVKGIPITKYCDEHRLTPRQRLELFIPVCQAVQHAHQKGIIHRDLKPSNVLVALYDGKPVPKVIDFGVAKAAAQPLTEQTLVTGFGAIVGTLEYMSPEQAEINQLDIDTRSDIYSLGVLLYELLTGSPPFTRKELEKAGMLEMLRVIREQEPSKPSTKLSKLSSHHAPRDEPGLGTRSVTPTLASIAANRGTEPARLTKLVRGELDWIVMKALEKDRNHRYETANGFAMDVQRYLADEPVLACPPSARYRLRKFVRRNKGPVLVATGFVGLAMLGIVGLIVGIVAINAERQRSAQERDEKAKALAAETNARAAEKQARDQALAALRAMTDEVIENQMARGTSLTDENKEFLRKILKHFEGLAAITGDDAESRAIRAEGYRRVGLMRARLGELKEAEAAYGDALAIQKQLAADFPTRPEFRQELASSYNNLGILLYNTSRPKEAEAAFADARGIYKQLAADFLTRPEFREELARSYNNLGNLLSEAGRLAEAETAYGDALAIKKQLAADFPTRPELRQDLAGSYNNLGILLSDTGRLKEAEAAYGDALALQKQLAADFPTRPDFREELAKSHNNLGALLSDTARLKEAEAAYGDALAIKKQLAAEFPSRPEFRQKLATSHNNLGNLFYTTHRLQEAEAAYADALTLQKQLAADFPIRPDFRQDLARTHNNLGALLSDTGRLKEAEAAYADALALRKQLAADFPNRPDLRNELAGTFVNLAVLCNQRREFAAAKAYLAEAQPHHQAALKANPRHPSYRELDRNSLAVLVMTQAGLRDQGGAVRAAAQLHDLGWDPPGNSYDAARALTLCIPIVQRDEKTAEEERAKAVQFYGDEAMKMLRDAVAKGYQDAAHMKKEADFDPLRQREEFRRLLAELEASEK